MSYKENVQKEIERKTGLCVEKINDLKKLEDAFEGGLADLYSRVFAEPPYLEKFLPEESIAVFKDYLYRGGAIYMARDPAAGNKVVSFLVTTPLKVEPEILSVLSDRIESDQAIYFADAGVEAAYRRRNISVMIKNFAFEDARLQGYKFGFSRTSAESYKQISAFNKVGGVTLAGVFQDVASRRLDGTLSRDRRIFYGYNIEDQQMAQKRVSSVRGTIERRGRQEVAIIENPGLTLDREFVSEWIKNAYPKVRQVEFSGPLALMTGALKRAFSQKREQGKNLFKGRFYLSPGNAPPF